MTDQPEQIQMELDGMEDVEKRHYSIEPTGDFTFRVSAPNRTTVIVELDRKLLVWDVYPEGQRDRYKRLGAIYQRISLLRVSDIADKVALLALTNWQPREGQKSDQRYRVKEWAVQRVAAAIGKRVTNEWERITHNLNPHVVQAIRRVYSLDGSGRFAGDPSIFDDKYIVQDLIHYPLCAMMVHQQAQAHNLTPEHLRNWMWFYAPMDYHDRERFIETGLTPDGKVPRIVRKILTKFPGNLPIPLVIENVHKTQFHRVVKDRIEMLAILDATRASLERNGNAYILPIVHRSTRKEILNACRYVSDQYFDECKFPGSRRYSNVLRYLRILFDYPKPYHGDIVGLARKSTEWHKEEEERKRIRRAHNDGDPCPPPPIPLPESDQIVFLETRGAMKNEGSEMGHCVGSYYSQAKDGSNYFFHVIGTDGSKATAQVSTRQSKVVQILGPHNRKNKACDEGKAILNQWAQDLRIDEPKKAFGLKNAQVGLINAEGEVVNLRAIDHMIAMEYDVQDAPDDARQGWADIAVEASREIRQIYQTYCAPGYVNHELIIQQAVRQLEIPFYANQERDPFAFPPPF